MIYENSQCPIHPPTEPNTIQSYLQPQQKQPSFHFLWILKAAVTEVSGSSRGWIKTKDRQGEVTQEVREGSRAYLTCVVLDPGFQGAALLLLPGPEMLSGSLYLNFPDVTELATLKMFTK